MFDSQQFFGYVGTGLLGMNLSKDSRVLLKDTTQ